MNLPLTSPTIREVVRDVHPNFPTGLKAAKSWTVLMDEAGSCFTDEVFARNLSVREKGRCVALLVPEGTELPALPPKWHAVDATQAEVEGNVTALLEANCGILGITADCLNRVHFNLWLLCFENLLDLIVRFLPLEEETVLRLRVEQRGAATPQNSLLLQKTCDDVLYRLSRAFPERAGKITFDACFIRKDEHEWNGYADTAAFLWGSPAQKDLLKRTGWLNTCFLGTDAVKLRNALDVLGRTASPTAEEWSALVLSDDARHASSAATALLTLLGKDAQSNPEVWNTYLNYVQNHLSSKAINLLTLARQIEWLKKFQPKTYALTPRLELIWLTVQLANDNHLGKTDSFQNMRQEFGKLCRQIYFEDAPLVCLTVLHSAVAFMNEFDFRKAAAAVQGWCRKPVEVMGRQNYGRLLSTCGQLKAFIGENAEAISLFQEAIRHFQLLSDTEPGALECRQTRAYLLIAMMDCAGTSAAALNRELNAYFGMPLQEAIPALACSDSPAEKYAHHVLLRWLTQRGTEEQKRLYLSQRSDWKQGFGHPWELIVFYRALLTDDATQRQTLLRQAADLAKESGDLTLKTIACTIIGALYYENRSCAEELRTLTQEVISGLSTLGKTRTRALERQLETPIPALALAKLVLPFNFR